MNKEIIHLAKKKYGQNFLNNKEILEKIQNSIPSDTLKCVEIGAGFGDLTKHLLHLDILSFEIDLDLKEHLLNIFHQEISNKKIEFIFEDILSKWGENLIPKPYQIVANLPYYVAKKIILKALMDSNCKYILVMIQKEVAMKFSAKVNDRNFSSLSVIASTFCNNTEILFDVPPEMFDPQPNVMSSVILFEKKENVSIDNSFLEFLKVSFSAPRKKLINSIAKVYGKDESLRVFKEIGLEENLRAHQVSTANYNVLFSKLQLPK